MSMLQTRARHGFLGLSQYAVVSRDYIATLLLEFSLKYILFVSSQAK